MCKPLLPEKVGGDPTPNKSFIKVLMENVKDNFIICSSQFSTKDRKSVFGCDFYKGTLVHLGFAREGTWASFTSTKQAEARARRSSSEALML